jgi:hypothetical protein
MPGWTKNRPLRSSDTAATEADGISWPDRIRKPTARLLLLQFQLLLAIILYELSK